MALQLANLRKETFEPLQALSRQDLLDLVDCYQTRIDDLVQQLYELKQMRKEFTRENSQLQNNFVEDMAANQAKVLELEETIKREAAQFKVRFQEKVDNRDLRLGEYSENRKSEIGVLTKSLETLTADYQDLRAIEQRKDQLLAEIRQLEEAYVVAQYDHHDRLNREEKKFVKQRTNVQNINANSLNEMKRTAAKLAEVLVAKQKATILEQNQKLKLSLRRLEQKIAKLQKQRTAQILESKEIFLNENIFVEEEEEYKATIQGKSGRISDLKQKIVFYKDQLAANGRTCKDKLASLLSQDGERTRELEEQFAAKREQVSQVAQQLARAKRLSDILLRQKDLTDQFFKSSIDSLRMKLVKSSKDSMRTRPTRGMLPGIRGKTDLSQVDLEGKEKILRVLYSKIIGCRK